MIHDGLKPNVVTYNVLLSGLCRVGGMDEKRALMDEMTSYNMLPNGFTYIILFDGLTRTGDSWALLSLFGESLKKGIMI
jgi:pentatricopeptide repeat protein